MRKITRNDELL